MNFNMNPYVRFWMVGLSVEWLNGRSVDYNFLTGRLKFPCSFQRTIGESLIKDDKER